MIIWPKNAAKARKYMKAFLKFKTTCTAENNNFSVQQAPTVVFTSVGSFFFHFRWPPFAPKR